MKTSNIPPIGANLGAIGEMSENLPAAGQTKPREIITIPRAKPNGGAIIITFQELKDRLEEYIRTQQGNNKPINIVEIAQLFGKSVKELREGRGFHKDRYTSELLKRAFLIAEADLNQRMLEGKPPIGLIFHAKNHYGYQDKQDISHDHTISIKRVSYYDESKASKGRKGANKRTENKNGDTSPE